MSWNPWTLISEFPVFEFTLCLINDLKKFLIPYKSLNCTIFRNSALKAWFSENWFRKVKINFRFKFFLFVKKILNLKFRNKNKNLRILYFSIGNFEKSNYFRNTHFPITTLVLIHQFEGLSHFLMLIVLIYTITNLTIKLCFFVGAKENSFSF